MRELTLNRQKFVEEAVRQYIDNQATEAKASGKGKKKSTQGKTNSKKRVSNKGLRS